MIDKYIGPSILPPSSPYLFPLPPLHRKQYNEAFKDNMNTVEEALQFAKDPATKKLTLTIGGETVGNGQHVPKHSEWTET